MALIIFRSWKNWLTKEKFGNFFLIIGINMNKNYWIKEDLV